MNLLPRRKTSPSLLEPPRPDVLATMLRHWFRTPQGAAVLATERALVEPVLERLFGYHILQMGCCGDHSLIESSPVGHKIIFAPDHRPGSTLPVADIEELPLPAESMDVVLIHHGLDFTSDCHRLLREATRVLRPGGRIVVIGFNPVGFWGLWRLFKRRNQVPWRGRFISRNRLTDWCRLLNLTTERSESAVHFPPLAMARLLRSARRWERLGGRLRSPLGGVYLVSCIKQVAPVTPITPSWLPMPAAATSIPAVENIRARNRLH